MAARFVNAPGGRVSLAFTGDKVAAEKKAGRHKDARLEAPIARSEVRDIREGDGLREEAAVP
jgi:hypothetical protein